MCRPRSPRPGNHCRRRCRRRRPSARSIRPIRPSSPSRSEERRVGKECRSRCDWSSDVCSSDLVQAAITAAGKSLPQAMSTPPTFRKINPADPPILTLSLRSETLPLTVVQENADNFLIPAISQVSGVARVSIGGDRKPAIRIQLDPAKLAASGLTLEEVRSTIVSATTNAAKGTLNTAKTAFTISANDQISEARLFEDVVL